jgi:hypothetical protein
MGAASGPSAAASREFSITVPPPGPVYEQTISSEVATITNNRSLSLSMRTTRMTAEFAER